MPFAAPVSFHQDLINQLNTFILNDEEREIAEFLVGSIDDMGYIRRSVPDIVDDMAFTQGIYTDEKNVERILHIIHELEPLPVVGARIIAGCSRDEQADTTENSTATSYVKSFYKTNFSYGRAVTSEAPKPVSSKARTAKAEDFSVTEIIVGKEKTARGYIITDNTTNKELYSVDVNRISKQ
ncbi:hypothetical protein FQR65_LT19815 [Abscondita terminalis]|nr:hypothetical protein FQR65_LT19815 [Abscondita terminalis]